MRTNSDRDDDIWVAEFYHEGRQNLTPSALGPGQHDHKLLVPQRVCRKGAPRIERGRNPGPRPRPYPAPQVDEPAAWIERGLEVPFFTQRRGALEVARRDGPLTKPLQEPAHLRHRELERRLGRPDIDEQGRVGAPAHQPCSSAGPKRR